MGAFCLALPTMTRARPARRTPLRPRAGETYDRAPKSEEKAMATTGPRVQAKDCSVGYEGPVEAPRGREIAARDFAREMGTQIPMLDE